MEGIQPQGLKTLSNVSEASPTLLEAEYSLCRYHISVSFFEVL